MATKSTKAQLEATKRYHEKIENIVVHVPKGKKAIVAAYAKENGKSMNQYIVDLIDKDMGESSEAGREEE